MKVMIVDDESTMLLAMKRMLSNVPDVELVGSFRHAAEALECVREKDVDLAILDVMIAEDDGIELARSLRSIDPKLDIVFTTSHTEFALPAYEVYPIDYMVKPISRLRLAQTITRAIQKRSVSPDVPAEESLEDEAVVGEKSIAPPLDAPLTPREKEVLQGIAAGWSNEEIAERLQISLSTVKVHARHVFAKLEVHNRVSAVTRAQQLFLLDT
jgi:DNA-binding NarL/FixJ family response regulator